jgi:DNA invertase Pin-like site-specific DNA recombinase
MLAIYCRISRDEGNVPNRSILNQTSFGISMAEKLGMPYSVYVDENLSGSLKDIKDRPQFNKMMNDINGGIITAIFATEQDRLERNPNIRFFLKELLKQNGVKLYSNNGLEDLTNFEDEFLGDIKSLMNQYYVNITSKKIKNVLKNNISKGKAHGILPYGYGKDENSILQIDEEEAKIVRNIYDMSLMGIGSNKIAEKLTEERIPTRYNKIGGKSIITIVNRYTGKVTKKDKKKINWSGKTIIDIIKNPLYKGIRIFSGIEYSSPAIFDKVYWKRVNDNLQKNRNNSGKQVNHKYMLKSVLECGGCGRNMYGRTRTDKKDNYYTCSGKRYKNWNCSTRSINIDILEDFIWSRFFESDELINLMQAYFDRDYDMISEIKIKIDIQNKKVSAFENEKRNAIRLAMKGLLTDSDIKSEVSRCSDYIDKAHNMIFEFEEQLKTFKNGDQMLQQLKSLNIHKKTKFTKNKPNISWNDKNTLINKYIKRIKVTSDDNLKLYNISIHFVIPIPQENYVMDYYKRIPYVDKFASIRVLYNSKDWQGNHSNNVINSN